MRPDRDERILALWDAAMTREEIAPRVGLTPAGVGAVVMKFRALGDPRAAPHHHSQCTPGRRALLAANRREQFRRSKELLKRRRLGFKFRSTTDELVALAAASTVEVTRLPPGIHAGWRPSWW